MSIYDLMSAVRSGEFESKFKKCDSTEDKIELFKHYGVIMSLEQYKEIESKVQEIKSGSEASYDYLEDKVEGRKPNSKLTDFELATVSAGKSNENNNEAHIVLEVLKRMPGVEPSVDTSNKSDVKIWEPESFLTDKGFF